MQFLHSGKMLHGACVVFYEALAHCHAPAGRNVNTPAGSRWLAPSSAARYNTTAQQRERIVERLRQGPATRSELQYVCRAPSVTKRISELRRMGWPIASASITETAPDGSVNRTQLYRLGEVDKVQAEMFETP